MTAHIHSVDIDSDSSDSSDSSDQSDQSDQSNQSNHYDLSEDSDASIGGMDLPRMATARFPSESMISSRLPATTFAASLLAGAVSTKAPPMAAAQAVHRKDQDHSMHSKPSSEKPTTLRNTSAPITPASSNSASLLNDLLVDRSHAKRQCVHKPNQPICGGCSRPVEPQDPMVTCYTCLAQKKTPTKKSTLSRDTPIYTASTPTHSNIQAAKYFGGKGKATGLKGTPLPSSVPEPDPDPIEDDICPVCDGECTCNPIVSIPLPSVRPSFSGKTLAAIETAVASIVQIPTEQTRQFKPSTATSRKSQAQTHSLSLPAIAHTPLPTSPKKATKSNRHSTLYATSPSPTTHIAIDEDPAIDFFGVGSSDLNDPSANHTGLDTASATFADTFSHSGASTVSMAELDDDTLDFFASLESSDDESVHSDCGETASYSHREAVASGDSIDFSNVDEDEDDTGDQEGYSSDDMEVYEEPDNDSDDQKAEEEIVMELVQGNLVNGWVSSDEEDSEEDGDFEVLFMSPETHGVANSFATPDRNIEDFNLGHISTISDQPSREPNILAALGDISSYAEEKLDVLPIKHEPISSKTGNATHDLGNVGSKAYINISEDMIPSSELFDEELIDEAEVIAGCNQNTPLSASLAISDEGSATSSNLLNSKSFAFDIRKTYLGPNGEIKTATKSIKLQVPEPSTSIGTYAASGGKRKGKRKSNTSSLTNNKAVNSSAIDSSAALASAIGPFPISSTKRLNQSVFSHPTAPLTPSTPSTTSNPWLTLAALKASTLTSMRQNAANAANAAAAAAANAAVANKMGSASDSKATVQPNMQITSALTAALASSLLKHGNLNMSTIAAAAAAMVSNPAALLAFSELRKREMDSFQFKIKAAAQAAVAAAAAASPFYRAMDGSLKLKQQDASAAAIVNALGSFGIGNASTNPVAKNIEDLVTLMQLQQNGTASHPSQATPSTSTSAQGTFAFSPPSVSPSASLPGTPMLENEQDGSLQSILFDDIMDSDRLDSCAEEDPASCSEFEMDMIANGGSNLGLSRWEKIPISTFWHSQRRTRRERQRMTANIANKLSPGVKSPCLKATLFDRRYRAAPSRRQFAVRRESDAASMFLVSPVLVPTGHEDHIQPNPEDPSTFEDSSVMSTLPPLTI
ncbi:hypothetical protein BASA62_000057 [Batrachochytrium salamandrivorans]|nr:hypothetical protein BASA62_000057 [Batrachochytrium salamandrivorans]